MNVPGAAGVPAMTVVYMAPAAISPDAGSLVARSIRDSGVTAVFAANDQMALGLLTGLREEGLDVPADIVERIHDGTLLYVDTKPLNTPVGRAASWSN